MTTLNSRQLKRLAGLLRSWRGELGISASEAARRSGVDAHTYIDLENGNQPRPTMQSLQRVARGLDIPVSDVLTAVEWLPKDELPNLKPYLRSKYHDMPESALADIEAYFEQVARRHRITTSGPGPGEDE